MQNTDVESGYKNRPHLWWYSQYITFWCHIIRLHHINCCHYEIIKVLYPTLSGLYTNRDNYVFWDGITIQMIWNDLPTIIHTDTNETDKYSLISLIHTETWNSKSTDLRVSIYIAYCISRCETWISLNQIWTMLHFHTNWHQCGLLLLRSLWALTHIRALCERLRFTPWLHY